MRLRQLWPLPVLAALLVSPCVLPAGVSGPPLDPGPAPTVVSPSPSPSPPAPAVRFRADALRRAITPGTIAEHLRRLNAIARANGGTRAAGTPGFTASADYAGGVLREAGLRVQRQRFPMAVFRVLEPSVLEGPGLDLRDGRDFRAVLYSGSGDAAGPLDDAGLGCSSGEYAGLPSGGVAVVRYGSCFTSTKVRNAQAAGAGALLVIRSDSLPGAPLRPTLGSPEGITIPVLALTPTAGDAVGAAEGSVVRVSVRAESPIVTVSNVIAEVGPASGPVLMAGAHLDSVIDGPGINDNGSGTAAILALGQALGRVRTPPRIRLALWGGEEYFLIGSATYVERLDPASRADITGYLNLDMVGSPNAIHVVYAADAGIRDALVAGLRDLPHEVQAPTGNSDHVSFAERGIPTGGIFTGALDRLTEPQAERYGGVAGAPSDPCYHQRCDTLANVDVSLAARIADAVAEAVVRLLAG